MASRPGQLASHLFGNETVKQLLIWQVLAQIMEPVLEPVTAAVRETFFELAPDLPIDPAGAVEAVLKSYWTSEEGRKQARRSGLDSRVFDQLVANAGEPPGLEFLMAAVRRKIIGLGGKGEDSITLEQAVAESRVKNKWYTTFEAMLTQPLSPADAVAGWVRGQLDEATAKEIAYQGGVSAEDAQRLYNITGRPPSPGELAELLRRGLIPLDGTGPTELSFQQGIYEGDTKNKWWQMYAKLADYIPPPRTVTAMLREGALTDARGLELFKDAGLSQELAAAYLAAAHHQKTQTERELAKSDVLDLYAAGIFDRATATGLLDQLGYSGASAAWLLDYRDFRSAKQLIDQALARLHTLFVNRKIAEQDALTDLDALQVAPAQRDRLLTVWKLERAATVKVLTPAEVAAAVFYGALTEEQGLAELEGMGYSPFDAWVVLADRLHGAPKTPMPTGRIPSPYLG